MKDLNETLNEISQINDWWYSLQKGFTDINKLDDVQRRLTGLYFYLSEITSAQYKDYLLSYVGRKVGLAKKEQALIDSKGTSATKAKTISAVEGEKLMILEAENEAIYQNCKLILSATAKMIEAVKQKISNLKTEINKN